jgi:RNA polymerase sigma factor (sigma-70 family)
LIKEAEIMAQEQEKHGHDRNGHPWEHRELTFQLLYWSKTGCQNWNDAADELRPLLVTTVTKFVRGRTHGGVPELAEDITQEYLKTTLFRLFETYDPDQPFFPYGYEGLWRLCRSYCRRNVKREFPGLSHEPIDHRLNPLRDERHCELRGMIGRALWQLPKEDRQAFLLRYWRKLRVSDIAKRQGCSSNALSIRLCRGRKMLKRLLARLREFFQKMR